MSDESTKLPPGKTCFHCKHFFRCTWLVLCQPENTKCDWSPSRFVPREDPK